MKNEYGLHWSDLKIGDVIRKGDFESMVLAIDRERSYTHIAVCSQYSNNCTWLSDDVLKSWKKVNV